MIETRGAVDALEEILAVPGLDGVFVGPSDLSISLSRGKTLDHRMPEAVAVMERLVAAAKACGKLSAIFCNGGEAAARNAAIGFDIMAVGVRPRLPHRRREGGPDDRAGRCRGGRRHAILKGRRPVGAESINSPPCETSCRHPMFSFFEGLISPTAAHRLIAPPAGLMRFYWHFIGQARALFACAVRRRG